MKTPRPSASASAHGRGAVLVVDDVESNLSAMEALLAELDCEVALAHSGNDALRTLLKRRFAVMLLDVQMPEMDGYEVARHARQNPATRDVPIVFLTAGGTADRGLDSQRLGLRGYEDSLAEANVLRGYGSGAVDFLFKPVNPMILRSKVQVFLELDQGRRQLIAARNELQARNEELRATVAAKAALADEFQRANAELERAYRELQAAQTTLIQTAKMASLGELVAGIAHEINNPLSFCVSHVETVKRCLSMIESCSGTSATDPAARPYWDRAHARLREMASGLARITDLVIKLRTFSRLDDGEVRRVDVREALDSVLTILGHRLAHRIQVQVECHPPERIECNPALFNQALMNLISNAIDAISGEGEISVWAGGVGEDYRIVVQDTGSGVAPELRERIFEPFFTTKPVGVGTGLGLSIAYSIVQKHGGAIRVEEPPGGGTKMTISIPLNAEERSRASAQGA